MSARILMVSVFVLLVYAAYTGQVANESLAGSQGPVQVTVFRSPT